MFDVMAQQIVALRAVIGSLQAQVDALAAMVDAMATQPGPAPAACPHLNRVDDGSTLAQSRERCLDCGVVLVGEAVP